MIAFKKNLLSKCWGAVLVVGCVQASPAAAAPAQGKQVFEAKNCGSCHQVSGPENAVPVAQRSRIKGPPLWFAGSKLQSRWLTEWLEKPTALYRVKYGSLDKGSNAHPALSKADAQEVGAYLMSLTDPALKAGAVAAEKLNSRKMFAAEKLFAKKQVCFGCHQYPAKQGEIGGFSGPTLVGAGGRLQVDWVYALLKDNVRYYPNGRMPAYGGTQAFEAFTDEELKLLAQYIGNL